MSAPSKPRFLFSLDLPTRWGDMDALGHVNNAHYFRYFEEARTQWLLQYERVWTEELGPVVAHAACTFRRPVVYPATLIIRLYADEPRRSSIVTRYRVFTDAAPEVLVAEGEATIVWINYASGRPVSLPDLFRRLWDEASESN